MKRENRMSVAEMDLVNSLISLTLVIDRLGLSERERALAYFRYIERDVEADLSAYASRFDQLVKDAKSEVVLKRLKECAVEARSGLTK